MTQDLARQVQALEEVCRSAITIARDLSTDDADLPTDCPGWSVKDHLAHMVGLEQVLCGAPEPRVELPDLDHVVNEIDGYMERHVQARRALPVGNVADEFEGMLPRRVAQLEALVALGDPDMAAPMGTVRPISRGLPMRVFDLWTHEQDMRRALGSPMRLDGVSGPIVAERILLLWSMALPRKDDIPPGTLRVEVTSPVQRSTTISLGESESAATLSGDLGVVARLVCGRGVPDEILASASVDGDRDWFDRVVPHLVLTP
ncbi:MAG: maleylpyruvate isomerase family mycothiol-dependent enzyme [Actinomycetota bacterium]